MFGEYYLLTKNDIKSLEIDSEKEVIHSIIEVENKNQKIKNIEINSKEFDDKVIVKDDMIFLLNDDFVVYSKLKSEVDIFIKKNLIQYALNLLQYIGKMKDFVNCKDYSDLIFSNALKI